MMSRLIAAAAAFALLGFGAAHAQTILSGDAAATYAFSTTEVDGASDDADADGLGLSGRVAIPVTPGLAVQLDAGYNTGSVEGGDSDVYGGTAHLFYRNEAFLVGVFAGASEVADVTAYGGGAEAALYLPTWTFGVRGSYATTEDLERSATLGGTTFRAEADADFYAIDGYATYFYTDNLAVRASAAYGQADLEATVSASTPAAARTLLTGDEELDFWSVGLSGEYKFDNAPVSLLAGVSYSDVDVVEATAITVGARWNFGQFTLKDRNRTGADLDGFFIPTLR